MLSGQGSHLLVKSLKVRKHGIEHLQSHTGYDGIVHHKEFLGRTAVHAVPEQTYVFQGSIRMLANEILHGRNKGKTALHDHPVFHDGGENKIHVHDGLEHSTGIDRTGKVEEYKVIITFQPAGNLCGLFRSRSDYRIGLASAVLKLAAEKPLVILALFQVLQIPSP